jgi:hypothetical protein
MAQSPVPFAKRTREHAIPDLRTLGAARVAPPDVALPGVVFCSWADALRARRLGFAAEHRPPVSEHSTTRLELLQIVVLVKFIEPEDEAYGL